jgi:hypothetical protein
LQLTFTSDPDVPIITSSDSAFLMPGQFFSRRLTADANASFSYIGSDGVKHEGPSIEGLPPGLRFDGVNLISGTYNGGNNGANANRLITNQSSAAVAIGAQVIHPNTITIRPRCIAICQPVATNDNGTSTAPLNFFEGSNLRASQPLDITMEATGPGGATVNFTPPTVTDDNGNNLSVSCSPPSGSTFPVGKTTVTSTSAADSSGAYAIVTFPVTVQDTTPPVITAMPTSITVAKHKTGKGQPQGAIVNFASQLSATDMVDGALTPTANPPSGSFFPLGTTAVVVTATDSHGNTATASFTATVVNKIKKIKKHKHH